MPKLNTKDRLALAALRLLERESWRNITLAGVARAAKLSMADVFPIAASKANLLDILLRHIGQETLKRYRPDKASKTPRERLFDVCMAWFDVQQPRKKAMRALYQGLGADPLTLLSARDAVMAGAEWLLALSEADGGPRTHIRPISLAGVLTRAVPVWLADDDEMGKTMAQLDRDLRRLERLLWPVEDSRKTQRSAGRAGASVKRGDELPRAVRRDGSRRE